MADWPNLFDDPLRVIKEKSGIFLPDFYRFASICGNWRSIALEKRPIFPPLLLLPFDEETNSCSLFNICNSNVIEIQLPGLHDRVVCATSHGWLITLDCELDIRLLNLFTKSEILLPRHPRFEELYEEIDEEGSDLQRAIYLNKAVLSVNPAVSPQNCFVAGFFGIRNELAFCRLGDDQWTTISQVDAAPCTDAIFYDRKIYAVNMYSQIYICDFSTELGVDPQVTLMSGPYEVPVIDGHMLPYLVESSGDLFCIMRYVTFFSREGCEADDYKTWKFQIYRLDRGSKVNKWDKIDCLGDRVLFLGGNHSFMLSPEVYELVEFRRNCIYFTEDYLEGYATRSYGCRDGGVFNLKDETIELYYPSSHHWPAPPIWFEQRI